MKFASVWERLYFTAESDSQKLAIMQNIVQQDSREMVPMLQEASEAAEHRRDRNGKFQSDQRQDRPGGALIDELGDLQAREASEELYRGDGAEQRPLPAGPGYLCPG
jgi:hypothetical protein